MAARASRNEQGPANPVSQRLDRHLRRSEYHGEVAAALASSGSSMSSTSRRRAGSTDTDMVARFEVEKNDPADVVRAALDGIEAGKIEVLADDASAQVKAALAADPGMLYPQIVPGT